MFLNLTTEDFMKDDLLHPNHTPEFVLLNLQATGRYPGDRCTGRSTALALEYIARAMRQPRKWHTITDHHPSFFAATCLRNIMQDMVAKLGLKGFVFKDSCVTWGLPE